MNSLSSLFRPWIQEMKQRWEELASAEVLGVPAEDSRRSTAYNPSPSAQGFPALRPDAAPSQTTSAAQ